MWLARAARPAASLVFGVILGCGRRRDEQGAGGRVLSVSMARRAKVAWPVEGRTVSQTPWLHKG